MIALEANELFPNFRSVHAGTEDGGRRTEDGGRKTEDGGQRTEDGGRRSGERGAGSGHATRVKGKVRRVRFLLFTAPREAIEPQGIIFLCFFSSPITPPREAIEPRGVIFTLHCSFCRFYCRLYCRFRLPFPVAVLHGLSACARLFGNVFLAKGRKPYHAETRRRREKTVV